MEWELGVPSRVWYTQEETRLLFTLKAMEGKLRYVAMPWPYSQVVQERADMDHAFACWELAKAKGLKRSDVRPRTDVLMQDGWEDESRRLYYWLYYRELCAASCNNDALHIHACEDVAAFMSRWCKVRAARDAGAQLSGYRYFRFWVWCDKHDLRLKYVKEV